MTAPAIAAARFAACLAVGAGLGLVYGFLRPLRPRLTTAADLIFLLFAFAGWVYAGFGICRGDPGISCTAGFIAGGILEECTVGRLLRPIFRGFWLPLQKIMQFLSIFSKKLFASAKKWVTIY